MSNTVSQMNEDKHWGWTPLEFVRVFYVAKRGSGFRAQYEVGEVGCTLPKGFFECLNTRTIHMGSAITRKKKLQGGR